jgi:SAM-dependent methyltransferase
VLDIGAGAGRHSLYLQANAVNVCGLDVSSGAVEVCRRQGIKETFCGSVNAFRREARSPVDCFLMLGNNLALLESREKAPELLAALAAISSPGSIVVGTGLNPIITTNPHHLEYQERNRSRGRMPGQIRMRIRHRRTATPWFDYLFASLHELERLLAGSPWNLEEHRGDGAAYAVVLPKTT